MTTVEMPSNLYPQENCEVCEGSGSTMEWHGVSDCYECFSDTRVTASQITTWLRGRVREHNAEAAAQRRAGRHDIAARWEDLANIDARIATFIESVWCPA